MMKNNRIYLFNPGHDLALANGDPYFYPSQAVRLMERDLSLLPLWYADRDSVVLSDDVNAQSFIDENARMLPSLQNVSAASSSSLQELLLSSSDTQWTFSPWGWDNAVATLLKRWGARDEQLPTDEQLKAIRWLSSRERAVELLPKLRLDNRFTGESYYLTDYQSCLNFMKGRDKCVFKAPLSGSGKGLNWYCDGVFSSPFERWCSRQISAQGGIVGEVYCDKYEDLAAEFFIDSEGKTSFAGYSFFSTSKSGVYECNLLVPNDYQSETDYKKTISGELIPEMQSEIEKMFGPSYRGYLGVDMMICNDGRDEKKFIHPCVEINARMTMGILARLFYDRYVEDPRIGKLYISYYKRAGEALSIHRDKLITNPLVIHDGRIHKGYITLTPVDEQTRCQVWAEIE
jgi:hypothetical protein